LFILNLKLLRTKFRMESYCLYFTGTEFKTSDCPITGVIRHMEIQRGKEGMKTNSSKERLGQLLDAP
jgi:hypothetical protein